MRKDSKAVHSGISVDPSTGAIIPPIHLSTTYERHTDGEYPLGYDYVRSGNPNREQLETCLAELEGGHQAIAYPSGMAATFAVLSALNPGDHVLAPLDAYYGTGELLRGHFSRWGLDCEFIDMTNLDTVQARLRDNTALVWTETPSNPLIAITDLAAVCELAHTNNTLVACDNTWATPLLQRPIEFGVDIVMHSTTKYLAGHSDVMGGAVITAGESELDTRLRELQTIAGLVPAPMDCWLTRRGIYSLAPRMQRHCDNAMALAKALEGHPALERVHYPGLESDPGHELASKQMSAFGGMVSIVVKGGKGAAFQVANGLKLIKRATSLGGPETLIEHRASIEGEHTLSPEGLLRIAVGLEDPADLLADLLTALNSVKT